MPKPLSKLRRVVARAGLPRPLSKLRGVVARRSAKDHLSDSDIKASFHTSGRFGKLRQTLGICLSLCALVVFLLFSSVYPVKAIFVFGSSSSHWDMVHGMGKSRAGGNIWHYGKDRFTQPWHYVAAAIRGRQNMSVVDLTCHIGLELALAKRRFPGLDMYGSDISSVAVSRSKEACPSCHVAQFDLSCFQEEECNYTFDRKFDYVILNNVLYYIPWAGHSLLVFDLWWRAEGWPDVIAAQDRFIRHLRSLVKVELVIGHDKPFEQMLMREGAWDPHWKVWRFPPLE